MGKYVAVYQGEIVATSAEIGEVFNTAKAQVGDKPILIQKVTETPIQEMRLPSSYYRLYNA